MRLLQELLRREGVALVSPGQAERSLADIKAKMPQGTELDWETRLVERLGISGIVTGTLEPLPDGRWEMSAQLTQWYLSVEHAGFQPYATLSETSLVSSLTPM